MSNLADPIPAAKPRAKSENIIVNLVCNVALPSLILAQLSDPKRLGPVWGLILAVMLPLGYGLWDFFHRRQFNLLSALGLVSVLITGVLGLLKTDPFWFAVKAGALGAVMGLAIPLTLKSRRPLVKQLLYNDQILATEKIESALAERGTAVGLDALLRRVSWILAATFFVSGIANFIMARWLVTAVSGSPEFNVQYGKLHALEWPIIALPNLAVMAWCLFGFLRDLGKLTGLSQDEMLHSSPSAGKSKDPNPQPWSRR